MDPKVDQARDRIGYCVFLLAILAVCSLATGKFYSQVGSFIFMSVYIGLLVLLWLVSVSTMWPLNRKDNRKYNSAHARARDARQRWLAIAEKVCEQRIVEINRG